MLGNVFELERIKCQYRMLNSMHERNLIFIILDSLKLHKIDIKLKFKNFPNFKNVHFEVVWIYFFCEWQSNFHVEVRIYLFC